MTVQNPENVQIVHVPRSTLGILIDHWLSMRGMRKAEKDAIRNMNRIARAAKRNIRRTLTQADLPAGRAARVVYRTNQAGELANGLVTILTAALAAQQAYRQIRTKPENTAPNPNPEPIGGQGQEDPPS